MPVERLWAAYADPGQLERFWGPPMYPATFLRHDLSPGGRSFYVMTGPEGDRHPGFWRFTAVDAPHSFTVQDGFADEDGHPVGALPETRMTMTFTATDSGSRLTMTSTFPSAGEMEKLESMGMIEGATAALGQIDEVLATPAPAAVGEKTRLVVLSDTLVRISRALPGTPEQVWRAHHDADVLRSWQLGPDGWSMPVCDPPGAVGEVYRYGWAPDAGGATGGPAASGVGPFGFTGTVLESAGPCREVVTERMADGDGVPVPDGPETRNEMTLTPLADGTLLSLLVTYPDAGTRDMILGTGMIDGMEMSYARLDGILS